MLLTLCDHPDALHRGGRLFFTRAQKAAVEKQVAKWWNAVQNAKNGQKAGQEACKVVVSVV